RGSQFLKQRYPNPAFGGQRGAFGWSFARGVKPDSIRILFKTCRNAGSPTQGVHDPGLGRDARISPYFKRFLWVADRPAGAFSDSAHDSGGRLHASLASVAARSTGTEIVVCRPALARRAPRASRVGIATADRCATLGARRPAIARGEEERSAVRATLPLQRIAPPGR